jgi:hypothetical protein
MSFNENMYISNQYISTVIASRNTMNNIINIISNQDRTLRAIVNQTLNNDNEQTQSVPLISRINPIPRYNRFGNRFSNRSSYANNTNYTREENVNNITPEPVSMPDILESIFPSQNDINVNNTTEEHIQHATEEVLFSSINNPLNSTCPISHDRFEPSHIVMQIIPCGHIFTPNNLRQWFRTNQRCPLCRLDITRYDPRQRINNPYNPINTSSSSSTTLSSVANIISNDLIRQIQDISGSIVNVEYSVSNNSRRDISNSRVEFDSSLSGLIQDNSNIIDVSNTQTTETSNVPSAEP